MNTLKEKITTLNNLILEGKALEAFEKFYHPEVVMQENETHQQLAKKQTVNVRWIFSTTLQHSEVQQ